MNTIIAPSTAQIEIKGSKFISHLVLMSDFEGLQDKLRRQHPKSRHVVYAYRYLNDFDQVVENSSDDGEPKGSAGVPALNVLRGNDLIGCAVLIVRYFGGVKLGVGGLVRAYTDATKAAIVESNMKKYEKLNTISYLSSYKDVEHIEYLLKRHDIKDIQKSFADNVIWQIAATSKQIDAFKNDAGRMIDEVPNLQ